MLVFGMALWSNVPSTGTTTAIWHLFCIYRWQIEQLRPSDACSGIAATHSFRATYVNYPPEAAMLQSTGDRLVSLLRQRKRT